VKFHGEELKIYGERMTVLQKAYNELLVLSNKRVSDLHSLYDFMQVKMKRKNQCSVSMTFWCRSGSADPCL
jgi:hypothetical protein